MQQPVVIFGSEGMLGSALVKQFGGTYTVIGLDRKDIDILDSAAVKEKLQTLKPLLVINATAYNNVDEAEHNSDAFELARKMNGEVVGVLATLTKELGIPLVHFSSEYVFDGANEKGYFEDAAPNPINKYGQTKAFGEKLTQKNTDQYYLVRLSRMFGKPGTSPTAKKSFVDTMLDLVEKQGKTELDIVNEERSCPTYSSDAAQFVFNLVTTKQPYGIYHGANSGTCTWYEFAMKIFALKDLRVQVNPVASEAFSRPAKRPANGELKNTKMPLQRGWEDALREYLQ